MRLVHTIDNFLRITPRESNTNTWKKNKYDTYREMIEFDPEVAAGVSRIASVVKKAYDAPQLLEEGNEKLLKDIETVLAEMNFREELPYITQDLIRDGDVIAIPKLAGQEEVVEDPLKTLKGGMESLPINIITITDEDTPKNSSDSRYVIRKREFYNINEETTSRGHYKKSKEIDGRFVWHISLNSRGTWVKDILGRNTFGVWSISPLESLKTMVRWKFQSIRDDIAWRHANVPRFDHSLDLSAVLDLNDYTGSIEERITAAQNAADLILNDYKDSLTVDDSGSVYPGQDDDMTMDVEQGFIHDKGTEVAQVGGHNTYAQCLDIVKRTDQSIATRLGIPMSALGYEEGSTYAIGKVTASFMNTYGLFILAAVQNDTLDFVRRVLESRKKIYTDGEWDKVYFNFKSIDFEELTAKVDAWTKAYKEGLVTLGEGRDGIGKSPLIQEELDEDHLNGQFHPQLTVSPNTLTMDTKTQAQLVGAEGNNTELRKDIERLNNKTRQQIEELFRAQ